MGFVHKTMNKTPDTDIWDKWIRSFHWLLVLLIPAQAIIAYGGDDMMNLHFIVGYVIMLLWAWRIIWGVIGSHTARFSSFIHSPTTVWRYIRGQHPTTVGHNPLGGYMVLLMLTTLMLQIASGLFASDGFSVSGPLVNWVTDEFAELMGEVHELAFLLLALLISLHILAILVYGLRGINLIKPMITGRNNNPD